MLALGTVSDNDQAVGPVAECVDGDVFALVRNETADQQVEVVGLSVVGLDPVDINRWMDDLRPASVVAMDPIRHAA